MNVNKFISNPSEIISVAVEEYEIEIADASYLLHVHMSVKGPHSGLWLWSIFPASEMLASRGESGYTVSRNEAVTQALNCIGMRGNHSDIDHCYRHNLLLGKNIVSHQYVMN